MGDGDGLRICKKEVQEVASATASDRCRDGGMRGGVEEGVVAVWEENHMNTWAEMDVVVLFLSQTYGVNISLLLAYNQIAGNGLAVVMGGKDGKNRRDGRW
ncbi:hypothetical protein L1887_08764 [Cichorium endivia]|nr:hypothetical protein L1887_08764 [Cichorium endivia]